jgi:hypothetical protein
MSKGKITFNPNYEKCIEAVLYLLSKKPKTNVYNLMKELFSADKFHLNTYGRPVTGDTYIRMPKGTVPSAIRDMLTGNSYRLAEIGLNEMPVTQQGFLLAPTRQPNLDVLSESDIEALDHGYSEYGELEFGEVKDKNHEEVCWQKTLPGKRIPFELMIEDEDLIEELKETAHLMVL